MNTLGLSHIQVTFTPFPDFGINAHSVRRSTARMSAQMCTQNISRTAGTKRKSENSSPKVSKYIRQVVPVDENLTTFQMPRRRNRPPHEAARTCPDPETSRYQPRKDDAKDGEYLLCAPQTPAVPLPDFSDSRSKSDLEGGMNEDMLLDRIDHFFPGVQSFQ